jgi:Leucine-rich repeat (LRR) protein
MKQLSVKKNQITSIHSKSFKDMKFLDTLDISFNFLTTLQDELIQSLPTTLKDLIMDKNISIVQTDTSKKIIDLTTTSLQTTSKQFSTDKPLMQSLSMTCNETSPAFVECYNIELVPKPYLVLIPRTAKKDNTAKITGFNLKDVKNLTVLSLMKNSLTTVSLDMFPLEFALKQISFKMNQIQAIDKKFIEKFNNLDLNAFVNNPCVIVENFNKTSNSIKLDQCFKNFEKK